MELNLTIAQTYCCAEVFTINGIEADITDFGDKQNDNPSRKRGCKNMVFQRKPSTPAILQKYNIIEMDYQFVAIELENKLSFRRCNWCC